MSPKDDHKCKKLIIAKLRFLGKKDDYKMNTLRSILFPCYLLRTGLEVICMNLHSQHRRPCSPV